jgi:DNA-binding response OmpR family regulator
MDPTHSRTAEATERAPEGAAEGRSWAGEGVGYNAGPRAAATAAETEEETVRILVVEDNPKMAFAIQSGLREQGYSVDVSHLGFEAEEMVGHEPYDLVILDLMLPDRDGVDVCRNMRRRRLGTPVLMLSALSGTNDKVSGLDAGADDYLAKPFEFDELLARVRALLRRGRATEATVLTYDELELDLARRTAKRGENKIKLSAKEFALLEFLMRNPDRVLERATIAQKVWDMNYEPTSNVIDVYISTLRKKIDKGYDHPLIHTVVGMGYRLGASETEPSASSS